MTLSTTVSLGFALALVGLFAGWRGARAPNPIKGPRMVPWRFIMLLAAAGALLFLFTALRLAGINPPGQ